jgi:hypothetical protein
MATSLDVLKRDIATDHQLASRWTSGQRLRAQLMGSI